MKVFRGNAVFAGVVFVATMILIVLPPVSNAATRYVAQNAGVVSGGSACNGQTAISYSTFNSTTNSPGDTIYLCGTITGSGAANENIITVVGSGTSGNPINVIFDTGAVLSAPTCNANGNDSGCLTISTPNNPQSYITVNGGTPCGWTNAGEAEPACNGSIVNTNSGTSLTQNTSTNAIEMEYCNGCVVENVGIYNLYVQSGGDTNANPQAENCITYSGTNNSIHDNRFHDVGWCLFYSGENGDNNNQVYQNDVYNTPHPVFFGTRSGTAQNQYIYSNYFHDYANWNTINCTYHVEGIHSSGPSNPPFPVFNGLYVYNNFIGGGDTGTCLYGEVFFSADTGSSTSTGLVNNSYVFNNLLISTTNGSSILTTTGNANHFYNNTVVYNSSTPAGICVSEDDIAGNASYTYFNENNAVSGCSNLMQSNQSAAPLGTIDYNAYANATGGNCFFLPAGATCNLATYQTAGIETHSVAALGSSAPNCCQGTLGLNTTTWVPQSGSIVIGAGANLYSTCSGQPNPGLGALCSDYAGAARPSSGAWTAGALQSGDSSAAPGKTPGAPSGLTGNAVPISN